MPPLHARVIGVGVLLALTAAPGLPATLAAAEPLKVFCTARPPDDGADERTREEQAEAPDAVSDIRDWLKTKRGFFTLVESRDEADLVIAVVARRVPRFGRRWITFDMTLGATPLGTRIAAAGGTWTQVSGRLVNALVDWTKRAGAPIGAALAGRPAPASEADRALLLQGLDRVGIDAAPPPKVAGGGQPSASAP